MVNGKWKKRFSLFTIYHLLFTSFSFSALPSIIRWFIRPRTDWLMISAERLAAGSVEHARASFLFLEALGQSQGGDEQNKARPLMIAALIKRKAARCSRVCAITDSIQATSSWPLPWAAQLKKSKHG